MLHAAIASRCSRSQTSAASFVHSGKGPFTGWKRHALVVANLTATSGELLEALVHRAARDPVMFTVLVPATRFGGGRSNAHEQLAEAIRLLGELGLEADRQVADTDPMVAIAEAWDPLRYDEITLSTLPEIAKR
jgi:hypothetical protein